MNRSIQIDQFSSLPTQQKTQILQLWSAEYPEIIAHKSLESLESYLNSLENTRHYFIADQSGESLARGATFQRDSETNFAMIVSRNAQGQGLGSQLIEAMKSAHDQLNGWIVIESGYKLSDGTDYKTPRVFYEKHGFLVHPEKGWNTDQMKTVRISWSAH